VQFIVQVRRCKDLLKIASFLLARRRRGLRRHGLEAFERRASYELSPAAQVADFPDRAVRSARGIPRRQENAACWAAVFADATRALLREAFGLGGRLVLEVIPIERTWHDELIVALIRAHARVRKSTGQRRFPATTTRLAHMTIRRNLIMYERLTDAARQALTAEMPGLDEALARIQAALDLTEHTCTSCGANRKHAYRDAQLHETLKAIRRKLSVWEKEALSGLVPRDRAMPD
jgi:hypothetical protein